MLRKGTRGVVQVPAARSLSPEKKTGLPSSRMFHSPIKAVDPLKIAVKTPVTLVKGWAESSFQHQ
jgi:hypothetical protein